MQRKPRSSKKETNAVGKFVNSDILSLSTKENLGTLRPPLVLKFKHKVSVTISRLNKRYYLHIPDKLVNKFFCFKMPIYCRLL